MDPFTLIVILIGATLVFDFLNGFHDSSNVMTTMITSRAISAKAALTMAAIAEFIGPFIFGHETFVVSSKQNLIIQDKENEIYDH